VNIEYYTIGVAVLKGSSAKFLKWKTELSMALFVISFGVRI
jgi:hypothetical protein